MARYPQHDERCDLADKDEALCTCGLSALYADRERLTAELAAEKEAHRVTAKDRDETLLTLGDLLLKTVAKRDHDELRAELDAVRATPLDATPLRERIAELEADDAKPARQHLRGHHITAPVEGCVLCAVLAERDALKAELQRRDAPVCLCSERLVVEVDTLKAELAEAKRSDVTRQWHTERDARIAAEAQVERLTDALEQVMVDICDPHPRNSTLEGFRKSLDATMRMLTEVLKETP